MSSADVVIDTKYGTFAVSPTADGTFYDRFRAGSYHQPDDVELLKQFIHSDSIAVDIGAHIGAMTIPFAASAKHVYAFEPTPTTREYLEKNVALNHRANVTVFPFALGAEDREAHIKVTNPRDSGQNMIAEEGNIPVQIRRLDDLVERADVMKIDAEGLECGVLEGGKNLIAAWHPVIFCEVNFGQLWTHKASPKKLEQMLRAAGYTLYLPLGRKRLGVISSLSLVTGLFFPGFFVGKYRNMAFDCVAALPKDLPADMEVVSSSRTLGWALGHKTTQNIKEHGQNIRRRLFGGEA